MVTGKRCFHLLHKHKSPKTAATTQRPHLLISTMNDFILVDFNLAVGWSIRQTNKFNSLPNFPAIWYVVGVWWCECDGVCGGSLVVWWCECCGSVWCKIVWWCVWWSVSAGCDGILCENVMVWVWWCECVMMWTKWWRTHWTWPCEVQSMQWVSPRRVSWGRQSDPQTVLQSVSNYKWLCVFVVKKSKLI